MIRLQFKYVFFTFFSDYPFLFRGSNELSAVSPTSFVALLEFSLSARVLPSDICLLVALRSQSYYETTKYFYSIVLICISSINIDVFRLHPFFSCIIFYSIGYWFQFFQVWRFYYYFNSSPLTKDYILAWICFSVAFDIT